MLKRVEETTWSWLDTVLFIIRTFWVLFNVTVNVIPLYSDPVKKGFLLAWFLGLYLIPYIFYRPTYKKLSYYLVAELLLTGSMFLFIAGRFHEVGSSILSILSFPLLTVAFVSQVRRYLWLSPLVSSLLILSGLTVGAFWGDENTPGRIVDLVMLYIFGFSLGRVAMINNSRKVLIEEIREKNRELESYSKQIEEKNKTLEQYTKRIEELTIQEERNRVSKDMHDTVGHVFTTVITRLDALPFLIKANQEKTNAYIKEISSLARKGLDEVRHTIHQFSSNEQNKSLSHLYKELIDDFVLHTGTEVDLHIEGQEKLIGESVKYALIRVLQESLTNAKRHGDATHIYIHLAFTKDVIHLEIQDNGNGSDNVTPGFGLHSMNDRMITLGGTFYIESKRHGGTKVVCKIPLPKEEMILQ